MSRDTMVRVGLSLILLGSLAYWSASSGQWILAIVLIASAPLTIRAATPGGGQGLALAAGRRASLMLKRIGLAFLRGLVAFAVILAAGSLLRLTGHVWLELAGSVAIAVALPLCLMLYPVIRVAVLYAGDRRPADQSVPPEIGAT